MEWEGLREEVWMSTPNDTPLSPLTARTGRLSELPIPERTEQVSPLLVRREGWGAFASHHPENLPLLGPEGADFLVHFFFLFFLAAAAAAWVAGVFVYTCCCCGC